MKPGYLRYCLLCCLISFGSGVAQVGPDSNQIGAWRNFNDRNENKWSVRWDKQRDPVPQP